MNDSAKNLLNLYIYSDKYLLNTFTITNSYQNEWISSYMNNQYQFLLSAAWHNLLVLCITHTSAVPGSKSLRNMETFRAK